MLECYKEFVRRLKCDFSSIKVVCIPEKQKARNCWHLHILLKDCNSKILYIPNEDMQSKYWRMGITETVRINDCSENYINIQKKMNQSEVYQDNEFGIDKLIEYLCKVRTKEDIPRDCHCYYKSKNVEQPRAEIKKYGDAVKELKEGYVLQKEKTTLIKSMETCKILRKVKIEKWVKQDNLPKKR